MIINGYEIKQGTNLTNANLRNANLRNANLRDAYLMEANLRNANLRNANLRNANLRYAYLMEANLTNADLMEADLTNADLRNANLTNADLTNADLTNANLRYTLCGNNKEVKTLHLGIWPIVITKNIMAIGCQQHSIEDWFSFGGDTIDKMHVDALTWWNKNKQILKLITENNND